VLDEATREVCEKATAVGGLTLELYGLTAVSHGWLASVKLFKKYEKISGGAGEFIPTPPEVQWFYQPIFGRKLGAD